MLLPVIFLFFITETKSINISSASYADIPKCCKVGSVFVEQSDGFFCNRSENGRAVIQTDFEVDVNSTEEYECVEAVNSDLFLFKRTPNETTVVKNISDRMLPKCCPEGYLYDPVAHSCVENFTETYFNVTFLIVGLLSCEIIYDYNFENMDGIQLEDDGIFISNFNEHIRRDKYCIDETVKGSYVARVCKDYDICDRVLCLHKCCPDGQSFVDGSHCKDTYKYGMELSRFSSFIPNNISGK